MMFFNLVSMLAIKDSGNADGYMKYLGVDAYAFFVYKDYTRSLMRMSSNKSCGR
jgi:hypothetical protein